MNDNDNVVQEFSDEQLDRLDQLTAAAAEFASVVADLSPVKLDSADITWPLIEAAGRLVVENGLKSQVRIPWRDEDGKVEEWENFGIKSAPQYVREVAVDPLLAAALKTPEFFRIRGIVFDLEKQNDPGGSGVLYVKSQDLLDHTRGTSAQEWVENYIRMETTVLFMNEKNAENGDRDVPHFMEGDILYYYDHETDTKGAVEMGESEDPDSPIWVEVREYGHSLQVFGEEDLIRLNKNYSSAEEIEDDLSYELSEAYLSWNFDVIKNYSQTTPREREYMLSSGALFAATDIVVDIPMLEYSLSGEDKGIQNAVLAEHALTQSNVLYYYDEFFDHVGYIELLESQSPYGVELQIVDLVGSKDHWTEKTRYYDTVFEEGEDIKKAISEELDYAVFSFDFDTVQRYAYSQTVENQDAVWNEGNMLHLEDIIVEPQLEDLER